MVTDIFNGYTYIYICTSFNIINIYVYIVMYYMYILMYFTYILCIYIWNLHTHHQTYIYIWDLLGHTSVIVLDNSLGLYIKNIMDYNGKQ